LGSTSTFADTPGAVTGTPGKPYFLFQAAAQGGIQRSAPSLPFRTNQRLSSLKNKRGLLVPVIAILSNYTRFYTFCQGDWWHTDSILSLWDVSFMMW
jgi:hypothetical protein